MSKKSFSPKITLWIVLSMNYKRKKDFVMKKIIALSIAVIMLFFGFATVADVAVAEPEMPLCEDIKPSGNPRDITVLA